MWLLVTALLLFRPATDPPATDPLAADSQQQSVGFMPSPPTEERQLRGLPPDSLVVGRFAGVTGTLAAVNIGLYVYQRHAWWAADHRGRFHFHSDGGYSEHLDKVGHFHATHLQSQVFARSLRWSGVSDGSAALWGSIASWTLQLNVEINDGFNELWGFDVADVVANTLGAGWFYARERVPVLQPFVMKLSYWPTEHMTTNLDEAFEGRPPSPIDDYMGHTYWVSARVHDLLPAAARLYWPRWLAVAGGVSGDRLYTDEAQRSYYVALDVDLEHLIPARTWLAATGLEILNFIKLPMPAARLHPRPTFYLVYYGQQ